MLPVHPVLRVLQVHLVLRGRQAPLDPQDQLGLLVLLDLQGQLVPQESQGLQDQLDPQDLTVFLRFLD